MFIFQTVCLGAVYLDPSISVKSKETSELCLWKSGVRLAQARLVIVVSPTP